MAAPMVLALGRMWSLRPCGQVLTQSRPSLWTRSLEASSGNPGLQAAPGLHTACRWGAWAPLASGAVPAARREAPVEPFGRGPRDREGFEAALRSFCQREVRRRGHVEFIYAALRAMPDFGVERELAVYHRILAVFPRGVFVPRNYIQRMFNHYPRQQECAVQVLEQMENYGVQPNMETKELLVQIFGPKGHPMRKFQRLMYWFPRFRHVNPFPVPRRLPSDPLALARLALPRLANDLSAEVTVYQEPGVCEGPDGEVMTLPHIVGIQSPDQKALLAEHDPQRPIFVEGPLPLWLRHTLVHYYVLRSDPLAPGEKVPKAIDPERNFFYPMEMNFDLERDLGDDDELDVEEVDEGLVFALCQTGSGDRISLSKWISGLQLTNPTLGLAQVVFQTRPPPPRDLLGRGAEPGDSPHHREQEEEEEEKKPGAQRMQQ